MTSSKGGSPGAVRPVDADLPDGVDEFGERVLVEHLPGLARVGPDVSHRDLGESQPGDRDEPFSAVRCFT
jgi:hypothetical protein